MKYVLHIKHINLTSIYILFLFLSSTLQAQDILLNEYLPHNTSGLVDEDNDFVPWIEIFNNSGSSKNLLGYGLSDDIKNPTKWVFSSTPIKTNQFMLYFVSGKSDRLKPFRWNTIIDKGDTWKYYSAYNEPPVNWKDENFNDTAWVEGPSGFGYGDDDDATKISNVNSVYIRKKFFIADVNDLSMLALNLDYDDAFVAYINGKEIARANIGTPGIVPKHSDVADNSAHEASIYKGLKPESFFVNNIQTTLHNGTNSIALQVHNSGTYSTDITLIPILSAVYRNNPPEGKPLSQYSPDLPIGIHINILPDKRSDSLYLFDPAGKLVDSLFYSGIPVNNSIGKSPNHGSLLVYDTPTPGNVNANTGKPFFPFNSSNLPIFVISTSGEVIPDTIKISADLGIINNSTGTVNKITDTFTDYNGKIGIEIRGSTSMSFPKKQYSFETQTDDGEDKNVELLGFPSESDWILHAPYSDKTLIRNALEYTLSRNIGRYATRTKFCELVLNNEYMGLYILMEKIKRNKNRVNISKLEPEDISGEDLTGGYIIKLDKFTGEGNDGWQSEFKKYRAIDAQLYYQYHYPKPEDIVPEQKEYIKTFLYNFESALAGSNFKDSVSGYRKYIDVDSFVDHLLLVEISKNIDGYRLSTFMYKENDSKGGLLNMGPVWDYNLAFGNSDYDDGAVTQGWQIDWHGGFQYTSVPFWWRRLLEDEYFCNKLKTRWVDLRKSVLSWSALENTIDSMLLIIDEARIRNFVRWPILDEYVWPNVIWNTTYEEEIDYLKTWLKKRIDWLDKNMPGKVITYLAEIESIQPNKYLLSQNFPNPFNPATTIEYSLPEGAARSIRVSLTVFDTLGREVAALVNEQQTPGKYSVKFDGRNYSSGIYYYKLIAGSKVFVNKMILLK